MQACGCNKSKQYDNSSTNDVMFSFVTMVVDVQYGQIIENTEVKSSYKGLKSESLPQIFV